jgi:iron complex outermembrane recepter protein
MDGKNNKTRGEKMTRQAILTAASPIAIAAAVLLSASSAWAQQPAPAPATAEDAGTEVEEVVVTGSLIRGTPKDTALPVEVYTQVELEKQGAPTALEFAKTLTISGPTTGEAYYFGGVAPGAVAYNLRGIGADKTLTLLNGRRVSENASNIPFIALSRTEVLKDGAAVTYGADAVGGVVNFITRKRFVGLEVSGQYKSIRGSNGDYSAAILGGFGEGDVNFLWSAEYEHRSRLNTLDRDFTYDSLNPLNPAGYNPAPWSTLTNLAGWLPRGALPALPSDATSTLSPAGGEWGNPTGGIVSNFTAASCAAVGGRFDNSFTCAYNYVSYYNLVEENDIYRAYAQLNAKLTDTIDAHFEVAYSHVSSPQIYGSPAQPVITGPALTTGATYQFYVPVTNPYAAAFKVSSGAPASTQGFTPVTYRAFAHGGNPFMGDGNGWGVPSKFYSDTFRVAGSLQGELGDFAFLKGVNYDVGLTYNNSNVYADSPDVLGFRLQEALNGFGGPGCSVPDLDANRFGTQNPALAGVGACKWWNPFATNFPEQPNLDLANPQFIAGTENSEELTRWLFDPRATKTLGQDMTFDAVINGQSGINLPGGAVGWAAGFQARWLESRETVRSNLYNGNQACPWPTTFTSTNASAAFGATGLLALANNPFSITDPRFRGCTADGPGPFTFFGINPPDNLDQHQYSYFGELEIPVFKDLSLQAAVRHEEFSNDLKTTVYKVAGKWHVWGPLSLRGSYGTNYLAPPLGTIPGEVNNAVRSYTVAGGNWLGAQFVTQASLKPETATAWNVGAIWQSKGFAPDHNFQLIVDYFDIVTEDEIGQIADPLTIARLVYNGGPANNGTITTCDPAVQPLLNRVTFNNGCTVGMSAIGSFASIQTLVGNGPGQTTNGVDVQATYSLPFWSGDLTLGLTATQVLELSTGPTSLDGVVVSTGDNRLGTLNFATVAAAAPEMRANFSANYARGDHNFRLGVNYVSAVRDEREGAQYGEYGSRWITVDATYRIQLREDVAVTASVANILDRDPPKAQEELGYDPRLGNPLGRTWEVGVKKTF